ncbi:Uncharacterised protein [Mycobacterium tuberculosis]|nr:Uncharacterised protein [Mycobacterium tuberculosis]
MPQMLGPLDEYPLHQLPQPIAWPGSSDRNFYDRSYFNAHDRTGNIFLITGIGYYPNLGVKDAFVLIRRADIQTAVHLSDAIDSDRLHQHVNGYRVEVVEPLRKLRIVLDETEGVAADLTWEGLFDVVQEQPHVLRSGNRVTLDAQRFAQLGTWSGRIVVDGERIAVDPATWLGSRDRSWGIRPVGEPEPAGRPADPPFEGMWWLYVPLAFDDFAVVLIIQEEPDGFRSLNDCTRIWRDGTSSSWAGRGCGSTTAPAPASRPGRRSRQAPPTARRCTSTWSPNWRCRPMSVAATGVTRTGHMACGRARSSSSEEPTT